MYEDEELLDLLLGDGFEREDHDVAMCLSLYEEPGHLDGDDRVRTVFYHTGSIACMTHKVH